MDLRLRLVVSLMNERIAKLRKQSIETLFIILVFPQLSCLKGKVKGFKFLPRHKDDTVDRKGTIIVIYQ